MATIKIPTPLRAYTGGEAKIEVTGETVGAVLEDLTAKHPELRQHIFEGNEVRSFVNVFIGQEDTRFRDGLETPVEPNDELRIIPSIAGGSDVRYVDHNALRTNQALIIGFLVAAFVLNVPLLVAFIAAVMVIGALYPPARLFVLFYKHVLKNRVIQPDVIADNPEPHRFSMALGGLFTSAATIAFVGSAPVLAWVLTGIVVVLAALNLFAGFCAGCFMYYQFNKLGVPGFVHAKVS